MTPTPTKRTQHTNNTTPQPQGNSTPALKAAVSASRMGDFEHSQANENHQNAKQRYDEKKEEISELEAQEALAKQRRDDEIQKARQTYEVESKYIGEKILVARRELHTLEIECRNGYVAVQSTARRAHGARGDVLLHNGGVQKAADIIVAHTLTSPMQGLGIHPADQPPPFALPSPAPVGATAAAAAAGRGGSGNIRRSTRLSTSRYATPSMLTGESKPTNRDGGDVGAWNETKAQPKQIISESEPWSKRDDEDDIISISSGGSESDDDIKCGRRSKKKTPAKTPNSKKKRIKDMSPEEYKAYRRPINRRGQATYRAKAEEKKGKLDDALELISRSPALQKQKNVDDHLNFANKMVDIMADARKDAFALATDMLASID